LQPTGEQPTQKSRKTKYFEIKYLELKSIEIGGECRIHREYFEDLGSRMGIFFMQS
jgi:hypothetical protein